ncbi:MAG: C25 family cysteine peptidase, partial [Bacteroidales bacterium]|nr:C25 family cysteine peptidase [Bacteroidales bacterium]
MNLKKVVAFSWLAFLSLWVLSQDLSAQILLPVGHSNQLQMNGNATESFTVNLETGQLQQLAVQTTQGVFTEIAFDNCTHTNVPGEPKIPVLRKLIEIPQNATCEVRVLNQSYRDYTLSELGIEHQLMPAQGPVSKEYDDVSVLPFHFNTSLYAKDCFTTQQLAIAEPVGQMRALNLALVELYPVQYNPARGILRIYDKLEVQVVFKKGDLAATDALKKKYGSPFFNQAYKMVSNYSDGGKELITDAPVTYVIISDPMFQTTLQPFIQWKTKKGFKIIEGYTNNASVGTTTTSIKNYLQGLYNNPPAGYNPPSFVLFVGDVAQIPTFNGTAGSHPTDLYYCEYTGDKIPEVYYGRFSATNTAQLQPQIDKTLEYEQYLFPDPSFLSRALLVAGADASHQLTWGNGQVNYGTSTYFNSAHNYNTLALLQPEPSGANYHQQIVNKVSEGVSIANYSAHCSESGWADPSFVISDIAGLTNTSKYSLMIGNCCLSNRFNTTCFGEEQLRAVNKGALGYIGGSNSTYWDEDYWWAVGMKTVTANPVYNASHLGAFDAVFHDHGEVPEDWFVTQGQMVVGGNMAVEESNSSMKTYYWEIYHLMGDPSVSVYLSVPSLLTASYQTTMLVGMNSLTVTTEQYAYVALSKSGVLLATAMAGPTGVVNLTFPALSSVGNCDIVITKQNRQPHIAQIQVVPAAGPYIVYDSHSISDPTGNNNGQMDFGEVNGLNVGLKNVGVENALAVNATLSSSDAYVSITDNTQSYGTINAGATVMQNNAFSVTVANNIPDQHVVNFAMATTSGTNTWNSAFSV